MPHTGQNTSRYSIDSLVVILGKNSGNIRKKKILKQLTIAGRFGSVSTGNASESHFNFCWRQLDECEIVGTL